MDCLFPIILSISFIIVFKDRRHRKVSIEDIDNVVTSLAPFEKLITQHRNLAIKIH